MPLVERLGIDDPIGAVAVHGLAGVWGTLATGLLAVPALAATVGVGHGGLLYTGSPYQLGVQALGLVAVGVFTFSASFGSLWALNRLWGIRVEQHVETAGLDVAEHGMWGYPEFYIPVPGGYGTESHGHSVSRTPARVARRCRSRGSRPAAEGLGSPRCRRSRRMPSSSRRRSCCCSCPGRPCSTS